MALEPKDVARILTRQFPELAPVNVAYLGAGMDSVAFEVNGCWVFRFPMRKVVERQLLVERALLPVLAPRLSLPVPAFTYLGQPDADFAMHFVGYEKLPGRPAVEIDPSRTAFDRLAEQIGPFLSSIHAFPVAEAKRLGAATSRIEDHFDEVRASALETTRILSESMPTLPADGVTRYLERLEQLAMAPWPLTLTHYDLAAEHILLDETGARVTGVIDWGDVSIGDPTVDFVGLFAWGGERFVRDVLASYDGPVDDRVLDRVRPWAAFRSVQDIRFGHDNNLPDVIALGVRALRQEIENPSAP